MHTPSSSHPYRSLLTAILLMVSTLVATNALQAQKGNTKFPVKGELVTVTDWGSRCLYIVSDAYFDETKDSIIAKIGAAEFEALAARCTVNKWPSGLYGSNLEGDEEKAFYDKLAQLKMYRIGAYQHVFKGKVFERYAMLRVPYAENKNWDPNVQWEGNIYFMIRDADVVPVAAH